MKSSPRIWNIAETRSEVTIFYEAIDTKGEFLDPTFATPQAAACALAKRVGIQL